MQQRSRSSSLPLRTQTLTLIACASWRVRSAQASARAAAVTLWSNVRWFPSTRQSAHAIQAFAMPLDHDQISSNATVGSNTLYEHPYCLAPQWITAYSISSIRFSTTSTTLTTTAIPITITNASTMNQLYPTRFTLRLNFIASFGSEFFCKHPQQMDLKSKISKILMRVKQYHWFTVHKSKSLKLIVQDDI